ncbi:MAG: acyltransferase [Candidatus Lokiarchaeota archaeon]|nr:acyltransferase [Candidatus Lokiarchaeota archaeon]
MIFEDKKKKIYISAKKIEIGKDVSFVNNIDIKVKGTFSIGDRSRLGTDVVIRGNNVKIGEDLFHSYGLRIGGGGSMHPNANITIGNRCTIHNNFLNACEPIIIGNDVGLSEDVAIITHGYWLSVLEGQPAKFSGVTISDGVIIGYRTIIMMGVTIGRNVVIGANSVVTKNLAENSIYAGNPAKLLRKIEPISKEKRPEKVKEVLAEYKKISDYHGINPKINFEYPKVYVNNCVFNVETLECEGEEDLETDDFRDYVRKWGFRFYTKRPFRSVWDWNSF